ncbi:hypothetical protein [Phytohabitans rumicis]|uniref:Uncharacterized protein n=1 Tax=Phytohabitans rumicis TaxID=1076125 RepID=A0A6V8L7T0_9ACTN|nr:hypothetical protein [Phytohabitans rumicis]GFJ90699.1 hypothetical protein Prum_043410 [Phytohabitans rumicis]
MIDQLEEALTRALTAAADGTPQPGDDFVSGVRHRQRQRRNRRVAAVAACAVVLTTVGTVTAISPSRPAPPPEPVAMSWWSGVVPDFAAAKAPQEVWPEAVRRLPQNLPDGRQYQVVAVIDEHRYLITTHEYVLTADGIVAQKPDPRPTGPSVFDVKANTVRPLFDPDSKIGADVVWYSADGAALVGDRAVWLIAVNRRSGGSFELWSSGVDGVGGPRRLAVVTGDRTVPHISVVGDAVYWQQTNANGQGSAGVYRQPVSGGAAERIAGSEGYTWFGVSPWVTNAEEAALPGQKPAPSKGTLWNLATGERRPWTVHPDARHLSCDPVLCAGQASDGKPVLQQLDGTEYQVLPYGDLRFAMQPAREGRFGVGSIARSDGRAEFIWDRYTGTAAVFHTGNKPGSRSESLEGMTVFGFENSTVQWSDGRGGSYVLDLAAIH